MSNATNQPPLAPAAASGSADFDVGDFDRTAHARSCISCTQCWYHDPEYGEGGTRGWVCDGRNGAQNLKSFPFRTEQRCFTPPNTASETHGG